MPFPLPCLSDQALRDGVLQHGFDVIPQRLRTFSDGVKAGEDCLLVNARLSPGTSVVDIIL